MGAAPAVAGVELRCCAQEGRQAPGGGGGELFCPSFALGAFLVGKVGETAGAGPGRKQPQGRFHRPGGESGLARLCHPGGLGHPARKREGQLEAGLAASFGAAGGLCAAKVLVLSDRGLQARWLHRKIVRLHWHRFMRINVQGYWVPTGAIGRLRPVASVAACRSSGPGSCAVRAWSPAASSLSPNLSPPPGSAMLKNLPLRREGRGRRQWGRAGTLCWREERAI